MPTRVNESRRKSTRLDDSRRKHASNNESRRDPSIREIKQRRQRRLSRRLLKKRIYILQAKFAIV